MQLTRTLIAAAGLCAALAWQAATAQAQSPKVIVSIKPVHALVAAIMEGVGQPQVLLEGNASPHTFNMRPSHARQLNQANVVFWVGAGLETFLEKPLQALGSKAEIVTLSEAPRLHLLDYRSDGAFEPDDHDHDHDHDHDEHADARHKDLHLWLDPRNARAMASEIAVRLSKADPAHAAQYAKNQQALDAQLAALDAELAEQLRPVQNKPFIVFHDAYQYLEHRYHLQAAGSITVSPETMPGAARIAQIRTIIRDRKVGCVFAEPQFQPRIIETLIEGTTARSGTLNPEGGELPASANLYFDLMRQNAKALADCLSQ